MRAIAIAAMLVVAFFSGWFLLVGLAAAGGLYCSGGDDCVSATDEAAPVIGALLFGFAVIALVGLFAGRKRVAMAGAAGHATASLTAFVMGGAGDGMTDYIARQPLVLVLVAGVLAADLLAAVALIERHGPASTL